MSWLSVKSNCSTTIRIIYKSEVTDNYYIFFQMYWNFLKFKICTFIFNILSNLILMFRYWFIQSFCTSLYQGSKIFHAGYAYLSSFGYFGYHNFRIHIFALFNEKARMNVTYVEFANFCYVSSILNIAIFE